jgi:hypothetical protein
MEPDEVPECLGVSARDRPSVPTPSSGEKRWFLDEEELALRDALRSIGPDPHPEV